MMAALANPLRPCIVATLARGRDYVSHLAREIGVSRPPAALAEAAKTLTGPDPAKGPGSRAHS